MIAAAAVLPWLYARSDFAATIPTAQIVQLSPTGQDLVLARQRTGLVVQRLVPWASALLLIAGLSSLVYGVAKWRGMQGLRDKEEALGVYIKERELEKMSPEEVAEEKLDEIADGEPYGEEDAEQQDVSERDEPEQRRGDAQREAEHPDHQDVIARIDRQMRRDLTNFMRSESQVLDLIERIVGPRKIGRHLKSRGVRLDAVLKHQAGSFVVEASWAASASELPRRIDRKLRHVRTALHSLEDGKAEGLLVMVVPDEVADGAYGAANRYPDPDLSIHIAVVGRSVVSSRDALGFFNGLPLAVQRTLSADPGIRRRLNMLRHVSDRPQRDS